jgi:hypothetical protein
MIEFTKNRIAGATREMKDSGMQKIVSILRHLSAVLVMSWYFHVLVSPSFASGCEILRQNMFERAQSVIVTDWNSGIPYRRLVTEVYPCASLLIRNNGWLGVYSTDIEVTAIFNDESTKSKKIEDEKKRIEPGEQYTCSVCFESSAGISKLECRFR